MENFQLSQIMSDYLSGLTFSQIARRYQTYPAKIKFNLEKAGVEIRPPLTRKLSPDQVQYILDVYETTRTEDIAQQLSVDNETVRRIIKKHNLPKRSHDIRSRKYFYDETFFDVIDTEQKAYVLGLFSSDGYNCSTLSRIGIAMTDSECIETIKSALKTDAPITVRNRKSTEKTVYQLHIHGKYIADALSNLGCGHHKTTTLEFPTLVPDHLMGAYIRGFLDGDGTVSNRRGLLCTSITSTQHFCQSLSTYLGYGQAYRRKDIKLDIWKFEITRHDKALLFRDFLYNDAHFYLKRKRDKFFSNDVSLIHRPRGWNRRKEYLTSY